MNASNATGLVRSGSPPTRRGEGGEIKKRVFGRLYEPDVRDANFPIRPKMSVARTINFKYWYPGVPLDQGSEPACVGYASWKWLYSRPVSNRSMPFMPYELYKEAQKWDEWSGEQYEGTSIRGAFKFLKNEGYVSEYQWGFDIETVLAYVLLTGPIVFGTTWFSDMSDPDSNNYLHVSGDKLGGHAYMLVGANRKRKNPDGTVGAFRMLNSWGSSWGSNGRSWLSFTDVEKLLGYNNTEACVAVELKK